MALLSRGSFIFFRARAFDKDVNPDDDDHVAQVKLRHRRKLEVEREYKDRQRLANAPHSKAGSKVPAELTSPFFEDGYDGGGTVFEEDDEGITYSTPSP